MFSFTRFVANREIDAWRDDQIAIAVRTMNDAVAIIDEALGALVATAGWRDTFLDTECFLAEAVDPFVQESGVGVAREIIDAANVALVPIVAHRAVWGSSVPVSIRRAGGGEAWRDLALAAGSLSGGVAAAAAVPALATTTTIAWFGLVTVATISWPLAAAGAAVAGAMVVTGAGATLRLPDKAYARLRRRAREHVVAALIDGAPGQPSILAQVVRILTDHAASARAL